MDLKKLIRSFNFASEGIVYAINTQRNMKIHLSVALLILLIGMYLHLNQFEVLIIFLCIALVMSSEIFNTAIEKIVDMLTIEYLPSAKAAKDLAAGAVLLIAIVATLIGIILLFPYLQAIYLGNWIKASVQPIAFYSSQALFLLLVTFTLKAFWYKTKIDKQPDICIGILLYLFSLLSLFFLEIRFLIGLILILYIVFLFFKKVSWIVIFQNGIISIGGSYLLHWAFY